MAAWQLAGCCVSTSFDSGIFCTAAVSLGDSALVTALCPSVTERGRLDFSPTSTATAANTTQRSHDRLAGHGGWSRHSVLSCRVGSCQQHSTPSDSESTTVWHLLLLGLLPKRCYAATDSCIILILISSHTRVNHTSSSLLRTCLGGAAYSAAAASPVSRAPSVRHRRRSELSGTRANHDYTAALSSSHDRTPGSSEECDV